MTTTAVFVGIAFMLGAAVIVRAANKIEQPKTAKKTIRRRKK